MGVRWAPGHSGGRRTWGLPAAKRVEKEQQICVDKAPAPRTEGCVHMGQGGGVLVSGLRGLRKVIFRWGLQGGRRISYWACGPMPSDVFTLLCPCTGPLSGEMVGSPFLLQYPPAPPMEEV